MENYKDFISTSIKIESVQLGRDIHDNISDIGITIQLELTSNGDLSHLIKEDNSINGVLLMDYLHKKYLGK